MAPLVFVHGYLGGSPQWWPQVSAFSGEFDVQTPDLPGFGLNSQREAPETIGGFANAVLDQLSHDFQICQNFVNASAAPDRASEGRVSTLRVRYSSASRDNLVFASCCVS